jgi:hypothetical protein
VAFGALFAALPLELRELIFSFLVVQPVKWDMTHRHDCPRRTSNGDLTPKKPKEMMCAMCDEPWWTEWRHGVHLQWTSPWRSQWAPEQLNTFVCSSCYDSRHKPFPRTVSLPCLCARRTNLQIFLVCRQWHQEAGHVFYTRNTFAFEDSSTFIHFIDNLPQRWRELLTKVSLMALVRYPTGFPHDTFVPNAILHGLQVAVEWNRSRPLWGRLRKLPNLSRLEIDAIYLTRVDTIKRMHRVGARNLRSITFVERLSEVDNSFGSTTVWPEFAGRTAMRGKFENYVATVIKGMRKRRSVKKNTALIGEGSKAVRQSIGLTYL